MIIGRAPAPSGAIKIKKNEEGVPRVVSCGCCEAEAECCMYPAQALTDGIISFEDLPDTVVYRGFTFAKLEPPEEYGSYTSYYLTGSEPVGNDGDFISIDSDGDVGQWLNYQAGGINGIGTCLIQSFDNITGVNDDFLDTYTVYIVGLADIFGETFTVFRRSLCVWSSDVDGGEPSGVILTPPQSFSEKWVLVVGGEAQAKDDPQNSPAGLYGNLGTEVFE